MPNVLSSRAVRATQVLLTAAAIGGCGSSSGPSSSTVADKTVLNLSKETPTEILKQSAAALKQVKNFRMQASVTELTKSPTRMLMSGALFSTRSFSMSFTQDGLGGDIVLDGRQAYMRAGVKFWSHVTHGNPVSRLLAGRWFKAPEGSVREFSTAAKDFTPRTLSSCMSGSTAGVVVVGRRTVAGQPAIVLSDPSGKTWRVTMAFAASGPPYPLQISVTGTPPAEQPSARKKGSCDSSGGPNWVGTVTLSDFNQVGKLQVPRHVITNIRAFVIHAVGTRAI